MDLGIVGLGLIGGSLAKAFKAKGHKVFASDYHGSTAGFAHLTGIIDATLDRETLSSCQIIFLAAPLNACKLWLEENSSLISENTIVIDCCGVKRSICTLGFNLAQAEGFTFIGGHPMAGKQVGGIKNSSEKLFEGATFALVIPTEEQNVQCSQIRLLDKLTIVKDVLTEVGFSKLVVMTADDHDKTIAFTSQLTHIVANCIVKNPLSCDERIAVRGGSFRDMTRVATMDEQMWSRLFLENKDYLLEQLRLFQNQLSVYEKVLEDGDEMALYELLKEGSQIKCSLDKSSLNK